jgi:hypothetical protein
MEAWNRRGFKGGVRRKRHSGARFCASPESKPPQGLRISGLRLRSALADLRRIPE